MRMTAHVKYLNRKQAGDLLEFGRYLVPTPCKPYPYPVKIYRAMEWYVLAREGSRMLLLSKNCIDWDFLDGTGYPQTWEHCYMRKKILPEFMEQLFTEEEKKLIAPTRLHTGDNHMYKTRGGNDTTDQLFLLSTEEFKRYLPNMEASAGLYFLEEELFPREGEENTYELCMEKYVWWLRSPGGEQTCNAVVWPDGTLDQEGLENGCDEVGIRPAVWIDLSAALKEADGEEGVRMPDFLGDEDLPF
jgi:hypothetical protein